MSSHVGTGEPEAEAEDRVRNSTDGPESSPKDKPASRGSRKESAATMVGNEHTHKSTEGDIDRIETAQNGELGTVDGGHSSHLADTVRHVTESAKRRLYLHHRHQKDLTKQFTPGSAAKHVGIGKRHADEEKAHDEDLEAETLPSASVGRNLLVMVTSFPYWNMAFWSGWCYSIGSAMFIIDGLWAWFPIVWPGHEFKNQEKYGVPLMFFFGACLYQIGGVMAYLEAVNDGSFAGAAMKRLLQGHQDLERELLDAKLHTFFGHIVPHHHHDDDDDHGKQRESHAVDTNNRQEALRAATRTDSNGQAIYDEARKHVERRGGVDHGPAEEKGEVREYLTWRWWPSWHSLWHYHIYELGYIACAIQLFGVTLYGVTSVVILPGIFDTLAWWQELAAYYIPQVIASVCFLVASVIFTIMAQDKWYQPKWGAVSWWIGIHAQIGSVGFLLSAIFGVCSNDHTWGTYENSLCSIWGSFFYMLSGLFQWYEAINVNVGPVLAFPNNRTPVLLRKKS